MDLSAFKVSKKNNQLAYRLVNSKFPPIPLFDDVANQDEFEAIYAIQALTNPRLLNELGDLNLLPKNEIPFGIEGCSYATAPFTHLNRAGSRFSDGSFGVLYLANEMETAIEETVYHQQKYFQNIVGLHYDTIVMRGLQFTISCQALDIKPAHEEIYLPNDYTHSRIFGLQAKSDGVEALEYNSVRRAGQLCWGLFTPKCVQKAIQVQHYEYVWNGHRIDDVNLLTKIR